MEQKPTNLIVLLIQAKIRAFVAEGDMKMAANLLWEFAELFDHNKLNEAILLLSEINTLEKNKRIGILDVDGTVEAVERRSLNQRLLAISDTIQIRRFNHLGLQ